jgi:hypothetical protein
MAAIICFYEDFFNRSGLNDQVRLLAGLGPDLPPAAGAAGPSFVHPYRPHGPLLATAWLKISPPQADNTHNAMQLRGITSRPAAAIPAIHSYLRVAGIQDFQQLVCGHH